MDLFSHFFPLIVFPVLLLCVSLTENGLVLPNLNCSFTSDFCSWKPISVGNDQWKLSNSTEIINGFLPPNGSLGMAYIVSSEDSWAELMSDKFDLDAPAELTFHLLQTRTDFGSKIPQAQLLQLAKNFTDVSIVWSAMESFRWKQFKVNLKPCSDCKLLFRFRVGFNRQVAALSGIIISNTTGDSNPADLTTKSPPISLGVKTKLLNAKLSRRPNSISCTFETDLCGWSSVGEDVWKREEKMEMLELILEKDENATDVFFAAFRGFGSNTVLNSTLRTPSFFNDRPRNLTFWYTQAGDTLKSSLFRLRAINELLMNSTNLWTFRKAAGKRKWCKETVLLDMVGNITLEFVCSANAYTICAVDNIEMEEEDRLLTFSNAGPALRTNILIILFLSLHLSARSLLS